MLTFLGETLISHFTCIPKMSWSLHGTRGTEYYHYSVMDDVSLSVIIYIYLFTYIKSILCLGICLVSLKLWD